MGVASIATLPWQTQASPNSPAVAGQNNATHNTQENRGIEKIKKIRARCSRTEAYRESDGNNFVLINYLFRIDSTLELLFHRIVPASGRSNKNGKYERRGHQSRNKIKGLDVVSIRLPQISEQVRSESGGECPRQHHQSENGSHVPGPKIISRERRSNSIS